METKRWSQSRRLLAFLLSALLCVSCVLPVMAETAATVQLSKTEGTVSVSGSSGRELTLINKMRLYNGYHTITQEKSYAWFTLDSSKLSKLDAASEMELRKSGRKLELLLDSGNLYFNVTEPLESDETLNIRTSTMVVGIRGTCGWVKVLDQWHSRICVLEGTVTCSVTDPVTGQTKSCSLSGGEWADCYVYPQDRAGDKCDIVRQQFSESDIDGFVLMELVNDGPLCEKIYAKSGLDLRALTASEAERKLAQDQQAMAEALRQAALDHESQENSVNVDPVWSRSGSGGGSGGGGSTTAPSTGVTGTTNTTTQALTMTMPVTIPQIQAALDRAGTSSVTVQAGTTGSNTLTQAAAGETLTVAQGKTLTLAGGVTLVVNGEVNVNGTMNVNGDLTNNGTITVTSPNSLHVSGRFMNNGTIKNIDSGHIVSAQGIQNSGTILTGGNAVLESSAAATVTMTADSAGLTLNGGSISNTGTGYAVLYEAGTPGTDITESSTASIWTAGDAPLAVKNSDGTVSENPALPGYTVVANGEQTSLRPTGGEAGSGTAYTVTFDANGGRWQSTAPTMRVEQGAAIGSLPAAPAFPDHTFTGWADSSGRVYTQDSTITGSVTLYAQWTGDGGSAGPETITVQFKMGDGTETVAASITLEKNSRLPYLPAGPEREGYTFLQWSSGTDSVLTADTTFTALWTENPKRSYTVAEANGNPELIKKALEAYDTVRITGSGGPVELGGLTIPAGRTLYLPSGVALGVSSGTLDNAGTISGSVAVSGSGKLICRGTITDPVTQSGGTVIIESTGRIQYKYTITGGSLVSSGVLFGLEMSGGAEVEINGGVIGNRVGGIPIRYGGGTLNLKNSIVWNPDGYAIQPDNTTDFSDISLSETILAVGSSTVTFPDTGATMIPKFIIDGDSGWTCDKYGCISWHGQRYGFKTCWFPLYEQ